MASVQTRRVAGATIGVTAGAGASAAMAAIAGKAIQIAATYAGKGVAAVVVPGAAVAIGSLAVYQGYKAAKEVSDKGGSLGQITAAAGLGAVGITPAAAQEIRKGAGIVTEQGLARENQERARRRETNATRAMAKAKPGTKAAAKAAAELEIARKDLETANQMYDRASGKTDTPKADAPVAKPVENISIAREIGNYFFGRDPRFAQREADLREGLREAREAMKREERGSGSSGKAGQGSQYEKREARVKELEGKMKELAKEERESNVVGNTIQTFLPLGTLLGGLAAGGAISGAKGITKAGNAAAREVAVLAKEAAKLTSRPGVIAGTVSGDKAAAAVSAAKNAVAGMGRTHMSNYAWPTFNIVAGSGELAYGFLGDRDKPMTQAARVGGAFELGLGLGQLKAVSHAVGAVRATHTSLQKLRSAENRLNREVAGGAMKGSRARVAGNVAQSKNLTHAKTLGTAAVRDRASMEAIGAGRQRGIATADKGRDIAVARQAGKRDVVRAQQDVSRARKVPVLFSANDAGGPAKSITTQRRRRYKDTWTDTRGRVYKRKDTSVRKAKDKKEIAS
jgi:hypothetical protein